MLQRCLSKGSAACGCPVQALRETLMAEREAATLDSYQKGLQQAQEEADRHVSLLQQELQVRRAGDGKAVPRQGWQWWQQEGGRDEGRNTSALTATATTLL